MRNRVATFVYTTIFFFFNTSLCQAANLPKTDCSGESKKVEKRYVHNDDQAPNGSVIKEVEDTLHAVDQFQAKSDLAAQSAQAQSQSNFQLEAVKMLEDGKKDSSLKFCVSLAHTSKLSKDEIQSLAKSGCNVSELNEKIAKNLKRFESDYKKWCDSSWGVSQKNSAPSNADETLHRLSNEQKPINAMMPQLMAKQAGLNNPTNSNFQQYRNPHSGQQKSPEGGLGIPGNTGN